MHRHGAHLLDATSARFALWAPDARSVSVELEQQPAIELLPDDEGWYTGVAPCQAGDRYHYRIDGELQVADPASRYQPDGVQGPSQVVDVASYAWQHPWQGRPWHEAVIQELHVGLLDGYQGVARQLPRLAELGISAIELMPLGQFPGERNWGYDGVLPYAPQNTYGSPEQLCALVDQAHGQGLMVLVDVVYNHFGPDGNYLHQYASSFFREDRQTPWGAAIDFRRPQVREYFIQNALMWLCDYRCDGLRLDAVHAIDQPDFLVELAQRVRAAVEPGRHVWLVLENEHNQAFLLEQGFDAQWNDDGHNVLHHLLTGEKEGYYSEFAEAPTTKLARCLGEGFIFQGEEDRRGHIRGAPSGHLPPTSFILFLQNHDQVGNRAFGERLDQLIEANANALAAARALLLLSPMVPLLFMGEEWGSQQPFLFFTDHNPALAKAVCEGRRNEFADFGHHQRDEIPDPNAVSTFENSRPDFAASKTPTQQQILTSYRQLLALRAAEITPRLVGAYSAGVTVLAEGALSAFWRMGDERLLRIDLNLGSATAAVKAPWEQARVLFNQGVDEASITQGVLPPYSALVTLDDGP